MRLTKKTLYELIEEAINFGAPRGKKRIKKKASSPTDMGSKENPCPGSSFGPGIGNKMFDPQRPGAAEWECSTKLEDDILTALQKFITANKWIANDSLAQTLSHLLDQVDDQTAPLRKNNTALVFRGASLNWSKRPEECIKIINSLNFDKPIAKRYSSGNRFYCFESSDYKYEPFRNYTSFSPKIKSAVDFAARAQGIIYITDASVAQSPSFFVEFTPKFYRLVNNPDYQTKGKLPFNVGVSGFINETEILYIGEAAIPIKGIYVNFDWLIPTFESYAGDNPSLKEKVEQIKKIATEKYRYGQQKRRR